MNKTLQKYIFSFFLIIGFITIACEGPEGPIGPEGEEGPQGEQGESGTANVFYSPWTDFESASWTLVTEVGENRRLYTIDESLITQEIMDQGFVLVYVRFSGAVDPRHLPFTGRITAIQDQELYFRLSANTITIVFHNLGDDDDPGSFGSSGSSYRYVIIPGGIPTKIPAGFWEDYEAVAEYFGIPE